MSPTAIAFDADLIRRYDRPGPRYTSYPTAPQFTRASTSARYREVAALSNERPDPAPLSLYVHVPFCTQPVLLLRLQPDHHPRRDQRGRPYLATLYREIDLVAAAVRSATATVRPAALRRRHAELPRTDAAAPS